MSGAFHLEKTSATSQARAGELLTSHGIIKTPVFAPVGSQACVKALTPDDLKEAGTGLVLANCYHLYLRPGIETISALGGLHRFMGWDGPLLTDSGGFQIFSLAPLARVSDEGVSFRSHIDGGVHHITPEEAVRFQEALGADIIMALDECPPSDADLERVDTATARTKQWAERCLKAHQRTDQMLFGIVQGGLSVTLRQQAASEMAALDFPGYAIGGLSLGEPKSATMEMVAATAACLPAERPRYLMGVGAPEDILEAISLGIDIFDSVLPTRVARNGALFTRPGRINIRNSAFSRQDDPVEADCPCYTCRRFSAAYLHHLFHAGELLAYRLASIHNVSFMNRLLGDIRAAILANRFEALRASFLDSYHQTDEGIRQEQKQRWLAKRRFRPPEW